MGQAFLKAQDAPQTLLEMVWFRPLSKSGSFEWLQGMMSGAGGVKAKLIPIPL